MTESRKALVALFIVQMDMLRDDFVSYSEGKKTVPFVVLRDALVAALNAYDDEAAIASAESDWIDFWQERFENGDDVPDKEHFVALRLAELTTRPAASVDVGQFREAVESWKTGLTCDRIHIRRVDSKHPDLRRLTKKIKEAERLLSLLDSAGGAKCGTCGEVIRPDTLTGTTCACATPQPDGGGWLVIAHGEAAEADAYACSTRAEVERALKLCLFDNGDASDHEEEMAEHMAYFDDADNWNGFGVMEPIRFEIGAIDIYKAWRLPIEPRPSAAAVVDGVIEFTDSDISEWRERHGLDGWSATDARCAFEDARTMTVAIATPRAEQGGQEVGK